MKNKIINFIILASVILAPSIYALEDEDVIDYTAPVSENCLEQDCTETQPTPIPIQIEEDKDEDEQAAVRPTEDISDIDMAELESIIKKETIEGTVLSKIKN
jgi:hypothetical protein